MSSNEHHWIVSGGVARKLVLIAALSMAAALTGCSADLGRFDLQGSGLSSDPPRSGRPIPAEPIRQNSGGTLNDSPADTYAYNPAPYSPTPSDSVRGPTEPVRQASLHNPGPREPIAPVAPRSNPEPSPAAATGKIVEVRSGDTLYGISRRHHVSISELMSLNGLKNPTIHPGQKLTLPTGGRRVVASRRTKLVSPGAPDPNALAKAPERATAISRPAQAAVESGSAPEGWGGTHTVSARDSLYGIARRYHVKVAELQAVNGITEPTKLRAGTVLKVPGARSGTAEIVPPVTAADPQPVSATWGENNRPTIINSTATRTERVAAVTPTSPVMTDAEPTVGSAKESAAAVGKQASPTKSAAGSPDTRFRWPAKGRIVAGFGPRSDNTHNDGINIMVPQGTAVHAAEAGVVAYSGSELKGYGNLVLIRHAGNWVSAYAHNDSVLVKRGDKIERGQTIAKAGKTGAVDQPQIHFELRQGSKPVDPMAHLEK